jgi:hypothetical protein
MQENFTLGDMADIEDVMGVPFNQLDFDNPSIKLTVAFVWVAKRRSDPSFTYEKARNLSIDGLEEAVKGIAPANPTLPPPGIPAEDASA